MRLGGAHALIQGRCGLCLLRDDAGVAMRPIQWSLCLTVYCAGVISFLAAESANLVKTAM
jgi:hypothetical protein